MWSDVTIQLIQIACDEDLGRLGDVTAELFDQPPVAMVGSIVPRTGGVICGLALAPEICAVFAQRLGRELEFEPVARGNRRREDGQAVEAGQAVATVRGPKPALLAVERTLLNFLGRMSGVATLTRRYVEAARKVNPDVQILDTRKTIPGWRELDKHAVRCGGGTNHRTGLYDAVLIKDNHLAGIPLERLARALTEMLRRISGPSAATESEPEAQATGPSEVSRAGSARRDRGSRGGSHPPYYAPKFVEVEVDKLEQLAEVCKVPGVDIVLLDNFSLDDMRRAVAYRDDQGLQGELALEASGRVTLDTVVGIAATGVDRISVGALTHSAPSLDLGLDF